MKKKWYKLIFISILFTLLINSCTEKYLDAKPRTDILQPTSIEEFQKLLDNDVVINTTNALGVLSADEYVFISDATWESSRTPKERNCYIWAKDLYEGEDLKHWNLPYTAIFYANNVLSGLHKIDKTELNAKEFDNTRGWALFVRAFGFYELINNFAPFYDKSTASEDLGVPLRLNPSIDEILPRSTVQECYNRILEDLTQATLLFNINISTARSRPSKAAAHALFARIYLNMRNYDKAERHADTCLSFYNKLIDYNTISKTATTPFPVNHDEQIYVKYGTSEVAYVAFDNAYVQISNELVNLYSPNDLRLIFFFNKQIDGTYRIKRGYTGSNYNPFVGLATDEVYLIKAECAARRGAIELAMDRLNQMVIKRWDPKATVPNKQYQNIAAGNVQEAINNVLTERRKELVWRGLRWDDLKRLNKEGTNITLTHTVKGQVYTLLPNDSKYVFPIPDNEISLSGIRQNLR